MGWKLNLGINFVSLLLVRVGYLECGFTLKSSIKYKVKTSEGEKGRATRGACVCVYVCLWNWSHCSDPALTRKSNGDSVIPRGQLRCYKKCGSLIIGHIISPSISSSPSCTIVLRQLETMHSMWFLPRLPVASIRKISLLSASVGGRTERKRVRRSFKVLCFYYMERKIQEPALLQQEILIQLILLWKE